MLNGNQADGNKKNDANSTEPEANMHQYSFITKIIEEEKNKLQTKNSFITEIVEENQKNLETQRENHFLRNKVEEESNQCSLVTKIKSEKKSEEKNYDQCSFIRQIRSEPKNKYKNYVQHSYVAEIVSVTAKGARKIKKANEPKAIKYLKSKAKQFKKDLRSSDINLAERAAERISILDRFVGMTTSEILEAKPRHGNCLDVIAKEKGFKNWTDLRLSMLSKERDGNV